MSAQTRISAAAVGAALASTAFFGGVASAQEAESEPPPCNPGYPPRPCPVVGGNPVDAPPLQADFGLGRAEVVAGKPVPVSSNGCAPGATVRLSLLRIASGAVPIQLASVLSDGNGGFQTSVVVPQGTPDGIYLLFSECETSSGETLVRGVPFAVTGGSGSTTSSTTAVRSTQGSTTTSKTAGTRTGLSAKALSTVEDLPTTWSAPAGWSAPAAVKLAVTKQMNVQIADLRFDLAVQEQALEQAAPKPAASPTDLTALYAAAGGALFLGLGAVGVQRRRRAAKAEVQA